MNFIKSAGIILISFGFLMAAGQNAGGVPQKPAVPAQHPDIKARMGQVISIDKSAGTFVLQNKKGLQNTFSISDSTKITLKGNKKFADITPGMGVFAVYQQKNGQYNVLRIEDMPDTTKKMPPDTKKNNTAIKRQTNSTTLSPVPKKPVVSKKDLSIQKGTFVSSNSASKYIVIDEHTILDTISYNDSTRIKTPSKTPAISDLKVGADLMICSRIINGRKTALEIWERFLKSNVKHVKLPADSTKNKNKDKRK